MQFDKGKNVKDLSITEFIKKLYLNILEYILEVREHFDVCVYFSIFEGNVLDDFWDFGQNKEFIGIEKMFFFYFCLYILFKLK